MKRFNVRQIEAFRAVVTLGSMTKAAELLGISQPAVSRLMNDFQEAVGFKLFRRHRGGAEPTDDARRLFEQVEKLFVGLDELNREVHSIRGVASGSVTIAAMGPYDNGVAPEMIARFARRHPGISVRLESQLQDRIPAWVASGRADIGIVTLPVQNASVPVHALLERPAMCVFPAGHAFAGRATISAGDLDGIDFVGFPRGTSFRFQTDTLFERLGIERNMLAEATTHEAVCNLVATGLGVSIVSPFSSHIRRNPRLAFRPFDPAIPISFGMIANEDNLSVAARAFHQLVLDEINSYRASLDRAEGAPH